MTRSRRVLPAWVMRYFCQICFVGVLLGGGGGGRWPNVARGQGQAIVPINVSDAATQAATIPSAIPQAAPATAPATSPTESPASQSAAGAAAGNPVAATSESQPATSVAEQAAPQPLPSDGKTYPITGLKIAYKSPQPQQPPVSELLNTPVKLGVVADGYVSPREGVPVVTIKLGQVGREGVQKIYRSGIAAIYGQIVHFYNARSIIGVFVVVDADDIDSNDNDIRPPDRTTLQLIVVTSSVKQVRTVAIGETSNDANRVDSPRHASIREKSPLQPESQTGSGPRRDLLKKDALDDYVLWLNRYPGRRVDVAVSGTDEPGGVTLDYLVSENRPWYVYAQASNTGTKQTSEWRERFGLVDNQLTGHDDILTLDYTTAGFSASQSVIGSYELPFFDFDRMRYKIYGSWNEYTASDVGQNNEQFTGTEWTVGNEVTWNVFQRRELFIDLLAGFRAQGIQTENLTAQVPGQAVYMEPYLGVRLERSTDIASTAAALTLVGYITNASEQDIVGLGRTDPTRDPVVLQFNFAQSAFLEPLLAPEQFAASKSTLAHEVFISARGQYAFNYRLFPNAQDVAGGFYSVRGYPESVVAGDSLIIATAEYRFHVPRVFGIHADPTTTPFLWERSFRFSPQQPYGRPDWDLILRAFVDVAEVVNSQRAAFENDATLVGVGLGVEFQLKQNLNFRVDWGTALTGVKDEANATDVRAGSNRFHFSTTLLY